MAQTHIELFQRHGCLEKCILGVKFHTVKEIKLRNVFVSKVLGLETHEIKIIEKICEKGFFSNATDPHQNGREL